MGGCISNSFKLSGACSRKEDPNDYDPTYIRIFGFFTILCAIVVLAVGSVQYIISVRVGFGANLGNGFILPAGAFWGGIFSFIAGFLALFHGFRQPFYNFNRPSGLYGAGACYPCTCAKMASLIAFLAMLICIGGAIWDFQCGRFYGLNLCYVCAAFNALAAICCLIIWAATLTQFGPCCSCCFTEYDRRHDGYAMEARDFFSYKNTMSGWYIHSQSVNSLFVDIDTNYLILLLQKHRTRTLSHSRSILRYKNTMSGRYIQFLLTLCWSILIYTHYSHCISFIARKNSTRMRS